MPGAHRTATGVGRVHGVGRLRSARLFRYAAPGADLFVPCSSPLAPGSLPPRTLAARLLPNFPGGGSPPVTLFLKGAVGCWGVSPRARGPADVGLVLGLIHASLFSQRHGPSFAIVCAPIVAEHIGSSRLRLSAWPGV